MIIRIQGSKLAWSIALLVLALSTANCSKKKSRGGDGGTSPEDEREDIIGQETEPITPDKVVTLETEETGAIRLLTVEATDTKLVGRHTSEYLLIVRSQANSCIRLKVRPTEGGVSDSIDTSNLEDDDGTAACTVEKEAGLAELAKRKRHQERTDHLNFEGPTQRALINREFGLVEHSLCAARLFRMPIENNEGTIENVRNKTGRLAYIKSIDIGGNEKKVNIWVDEEIVRISCDANGMVDNNAVAFSPLWKYDQHGYFDKFIFEHVQALAHNVAESYKTLAETYGDISDVDENSSLDVFVSPEVNRLHFENVLTYEVNYFRANINLRTNDLANYDAATNPAGNEGEIVYLWAPDPFARFSAQKFPSSSSLTSNYARGYAGSQILNLIGSKKKLLDRKKPQEETWLREVLGFLASDYVGGNNYSFFYKANYLSSRPQHISITEPINEKFFTGNSKISAYFEQKGMRAMFGWYLHSLLCGPTLTPCGEILKLLDTDEIGIANVEAVTGKKFSKLLEHFGLSVGIELVDNPSSAKSFWDNPVEGMPDKFIDLPPLRQVQNGGETQYVNVTIDAQTATVETQRRFAGPFVSYDMELFQPIYPDNDLDISLEKNSVTYILLTGLLEKKTDITAALGTFLNVVIIPIGERVYNATKEDGHKRSRFIHNEKVSENSQYDVAPVNLTSTIANFAAPAGDNSWDPNFLYPDATYYMPNEYPALQSDETTVITRDREMVIVGNIENQSITIRGQESTLGDTDAYNFEVDPCKDAADLAACQAREHQVIVQMYARDYTSEVNPMFLITNTDPKLFRGAQILGDLSKWDPTWVPLEERDIDLICESSGPPPTKCATNGTLYPNGDSKPWFDHYDYMLSKNFTHSYDTFLFMGPLTFPFYNVRNIRDDLDDNERIHMFDFGRQEARRMFYDFNFDPNAEPRRYVFHYAGFDNTLSDHAFEPGQGSNIPYGFVDFHTQMSDDELDNYLHVKSLMDSWVAQVSEEQAEEFVGFCSNLGVAAGTCRIYGAATNASFPTLDAAIKATLYTDEGRRKYVVCYDSTDCAGKLNYSGGGINLVGPNTTNWNVPYIGMFGYEVYTSYYNFIRSDEPPSANGCNAQAVANPIDNQAFNLMCEVDSNAPYFMEEGDIRRQFNVAKHEFRLGCFTRSRMTETICDLADHKVSTDAISFWRAMEPEEKILHFTQARQYITQEFNPTDNVHLPLNILNYSAGELVGKEERFHEQAIKIPGGSSSFFQVIVGGRLKTQGKYVLRVRVKDFEAIDVDQLNTGNY